MAAGKFGNPAGRRKGGPRGIHMLLGPRNGSTDFLRHIEVHDSYNRHEVEHLVAAANGPTMCPRCGEVYRATSKRDLLTGLCKNANICSKRRAELDDETIEFLGLIPRGKEDDNGTETRPL